MQRSSLVLVVMLFAGGCLSNKVWYPDYQAVPRSRAELAADRYTHDLEKSSGASVSLGSNY